MPDKCLIMIGVSATTPAYPAFWTRAVALRPLSADGLKEGKTPDRATLIAISRACAMAIPDFPPMAPTRIQRAELTEYAALQTDGLRRLIARIGGFQEPILTLEWKHRDRPPLPPESFVSLPLLQYCEMRDAPL